MGRGHWCIELATGTSERDCGRLYLGGCVPRSSLLLRAGSTGARRSSARRDPRRQWHGSTLTTAHTLMFGRPRAEFEISISKDGFYNPTPIAIPSTFRFRRIPSGRLPRPVRRSASPSRSRPGTVAPPRRATRGLTRRSRGSPLKPVLPVDRMRAAARLPRLRRDERQPTR